MYKKISLLFSLLVAAGLVLQGYAQQNPGIVISEIYYDSYYPEDINLAASHRGEFIELYNYSNTDINLSGWKLDDYNPYTAFAFPYGTIIKAHNFIVVTRGIRGYVNGNELNQLFGINLTNENRIIFDQFSGNILLDNDQDFVALIDNNGYTIDFIAWGMNYNGLNWRSLQAINGYQANPDNQRSIQRIANVSSAASVSFNPTFHNVQKATPLALPPGISISLVEPIQPLQATPCNSPSTSDMNYIRSTTWQVAAQNESDIASFDPNKQIQTTEYYDGLGRPIQQVSRQASPAKNDLVQHMEYDAFGREAIKYLPYTGCNDGLFQTDALAAQASFYTAARTAVANDAKPYAVTKFEPSPLNRVIQLGAAGAAWQPVANDITGNTTKISYLYNNSYEVRLWTYDYSTGLVSSANTYDGNTLYKTQTTDENGNPSYEFKNKEGRLVYKTEGSPHYCNHCQGIDVYADYFETYYVYDDFGNLRVVIPPQAIKKLRDAGNWTISSAFQDLWCFQYKYDARKRMTQKKVPGAGWVHMFYDPRDRVVLTQDANQRTNVQYTFTKYDALNRPVLTGIFTMPTLFIPETMQEIINNYYTRATNPRSYFVTRENNTIGYSDDSYPKSTDDASLTLEYHTTTFYDDYTFKAETEWTPTATTAYDFVAELGNTWSSSLPNRGRVTGTKVKVLGETTWLKTVNYYDDKGRLIQSIADNYVSSSSLGKDRTTMALDFTGKVTSKLLSHTGIETVTTKETYSYDHMGRLLDVYHGVAAGTTAPTTLTHLSHNTYNELGQLVDKQLGITDGTTPTNLQSVDYRYNIRGWLKSINNASLSNDGKVSNDDANDLWGMELKYNDPVTGGTAQFNGNISEMVWNRRDFTDNATIQNRWGNQYSYDPLNRLLSSTSLRKIGDGGAPWSADTKYDETFGYDKNGNILSLSRNGVPSGTIVSLDNLSYTYNGNQVTKIEDATHYTEGFSNGSTAVTEYGYDANGNMVTDLNAGITIVYNRLNLPQTTTKGGIVTTYTYDATGRKWKKTTVKAGNPTSYYMGALQFDQTNGTEFLYFLNTAEGRVRKDVTWSKYEYFLKDHLGNVRMSFDKNAGGTAQIIQADAYYSFGSPIIEGSIGPNATKFSNSLKNNYLYNGKEKQEENGYYDYGARFYDPVRGQFTSVDPKAEKFPYASPYNFVLNNPLTNIDPDGAEVIIGFNKRTGKLAITDLDHYKKGLPIKVVSAKDYVHGGIRDDKGNLTHNQILVMENVFSGGRVEADGTITRDLDRDKYEVAIPNGSFDLTEYEGGRGWYKVDPIDESRYDDHHQGYTNADGETRNGYRFHLGGLSHGCITVCDPNGERQDEWNVVGKILENTSKTEVPKREGMQKYIPGTTRLKYGTINVTGVDRVKEVKKEE